MKTLFLAAFAVLGSLVSFGQELKADQVIKVNTEVYDFGKIKKDVPVTTYFEIINISDKPVVVENAWAGCGCTTPEVPKEPIAPGAAVKLKVVYNAAALAGFTKEVYIKLAGVNEPKVVKIKGEVVESGAAAVPATPATPAAKPAAKSKTVATKKVVKKTTKA